MGTVHVPLLPFGAAYHTAGLALRTVSTTAAVIPWLAFNSSTTEYAIYILQAIRYGGGYLTLDIDWFADADSAGLAYWAADLSVLTPNTDTTDIETIAFSGRVDNSVSHLGVDTQRLQRATLVLSNTEGLAEDDWYALRIYRDSNDSVNDTLIGDLEFCLGNVSYTDSGN